MNRLTQVALTIYAASLFLASTAAFFGMANWVLPLGAPALGLSGMAFLGHLVTLDDDSPGSFGNPDHDQSLWTESVQELRVKFFVCLFAVAVICIACHLGGVW